MSISIKNHEDRIKALENAGAGGDIITPDYARAFAISSGYVCTQTGYIVFNDAELEGYRRHIAINDVILFSTSAWAGRYYSMMNALCPVKPGDKITYNIRGEKFDAKFSVAFIPAVKSTLKLYYNFSYNIKREFYKVKFYTKRFICLHLKNFVLNKGGVKKCQLV